MPKILFISHSASRTGAPIMLLHTARALVASGFEGEFIIGEDGPLLPDFRAIGETHVDSLYPPGLKYWREIKRVASRFGLLRKSRPDVVYCNTIHTAKWLLYSRIARVKTLMHVHELSMGFANLGRQEHLIVRNCGDRFIAASGVVQTYLTDVQGVPLGKIDIVPSSIDAAYFARYGRAPAGIGVLKSKLGLDGTLVVGNVGRITHMKGTDLLLDVAALIRKQLPEERIKFLLIATADDPAFYARWKSLLEERGLQDSFVFVEDQSDVRPYYAMMDLYVSTAREDPFPLVVLEAMASALPVVAFAAGGIPEQLAHGSGILVSGLNVPRMTDEIVRLIRSPQLRIQLGTAAKNRVAAYFDLSVTAPMFESVLRRMLG